MIAPAGISFQANKGLRLRKSAEDKKEPQIKTSMAVSTNMSLSLYNENKMVY